VRRLKSPVADPPSNQREIIDANRGERRWVEARRARDPDVRGSDTRSVDAGQKEPRLVRREVTAEPREQRQEPRAERSPVERRNVERPEPVRDRREIQRAPAREATPAREPERAPAREAAPERRQVERPSAPPPQDRGGSRPSNDGGRRRR
jgi:hypothetical protein